MFRFRFITYGVRTMNEEFFIDMISQFGFPILVCLWFMIRTEKVINNNTKVMSEVNQVISRCKGVNQ